MLISKIYVAALRNSSTGGIWTYINKLHRTLPMDSSRHFCSVSCFVLSTSCLNHSKASFNKQIIEIFLAKNVQGHRMEKNDMLTKYQFHPLFHQQLMYSYCKFNTANATFEKCSKHFWNPKTLIQVHFHRSLKRGYLLACSGVSANDKF